MGVVRKNKSRGYQQLRVWSDAVEFYSMDSRIFLELPFSLKQVRSQQFDSSDSIYQTSTTSLTSSPPILQHVLAGGGVYG